MGACNDCWRLRRRCRADRADSLGSEGDTDARQIQAVARRACILYRGLCKSVSAMQRTAPVWCVRFEGPMTAIGYVFAAAMTVLIVWIVAEVAIVAALKGPRSMQREAIKRR